MELICSFFVASWTGVVKYHGPRPSMRPKQVRSIFFVKSPRACVVFVSLNFGLNLFGTGFCG